MRQLAVTVKSGALVCKSLYLCGLETEEAPKVFNYVHLLARSMGLGYIDEYKDWTKSGANAGAQIGEARLAQIGVQFFERAMLPELMKRPMGLDPTSKEQKK